MPNRFTGPRLSARETELLTRLERERRSRVTLGELSTYYGRGRAYEVVRSLVGKGVFSRVGRATYIAHPFRTLGRPWSPSAPVAAAQLLADEPYYLGGYWAWSYHRLTEQVHGSRIDAFVTRWRPARAVANARIVFHRTAPARLMFGTVQVTIEHLAVCVSDLERTLLDALDYPNLLGSLSDSVERVTAALHKANTKQLIAHAAHGSRSSTCQRIGLLLERHGVPAAALQPLRRRVMRSASVLSLWPNRQRSGRVHPLWRVVENDQDGRD